MYEKKFNIKIIKIKLYYKNLFIIFEFFLFKYFFNIVKKHSYYSYDYFIIQKILML
jgi:hypothetical protein